MALALLAACSASGPVLDTSNPSFVGDMPADFSGSWERDYSRGEDVQGALNTLFRARQRQIQQPRQQVDQQVPQRHQRIGQFDGGHVAYALLGRRAWPLATIVFFMLLALGFLWVRHMVSGLGLGDNTRAALITRGLAEVMRLGAAMKADPRTLMGLAGIGDLVLTCTGDLSRNRRMGLALGRGQTVEEAQAEIGQVVEGVNTSKETMRLAERHGVEMPITEQVHGILFKGWNAQKGVRVLMERDLKRETE